MSLNDIPKNGNYWECTPQDIAYMRMALEEAAKAAQGGDVPVGAVLVADEDGRILARGHNTRELLQTALGHAELNVLESACADLGTRRLPPCTLYVTLEPCPMCAGAILQARIGRVICGASDPMMGAMGSIWTIHKHPMRWAQHTSVFVGCLENECREVLREFFRQRRRAAK